MPDTQKRFSTAVMLLIAALLLRGLFLEYNDLIDPTEARYANVAQEMFLSGNWLTPQIHMPEGVVPYLGKPPMHFWITGIFFEIFGMDEWCARLPSFLAALSILYLIYNFCLSIFGRETALISCLICFSSCMFFFLSGASVTDVTLTAFITCAIFFLYRGIKPDEPLVRSIYIAVFFTALSFLTKGPIAIVLVFFPLILWSIITKDWSWMKKIPWIKSALLFTIIAIPWFIASEIENPGFIKYFVWNENIARYLFKDYGDKYGAGHVYMHGASWIMLFTAFVPWTFILFYKLFRTGWKESWKYLSADKDRLFVLCWAISSPLFFTMVRQLHAMYLLPAFPPLSILLALILDKNPIVWTKEHFKKYAVSSVIALIILIITASILFDFSNYLLWIFGAFYLVGLIWIWRQNLPILNIQAISSTFVFIVTFYFVSIVCVTPYLDNRRSSENILRELTESYVGKGAVPKIGVISRSIFSHYWTANAWQNELNSKIDIRYVRPEDINNADIAYVLARDKADTLPPQVIEKFEPAFHSGPWKLFKRK
jgi:4-amino-4-deoxy-L-arabinose transferase-like glycosyltransferase